MANKRFSLSPEEYKRYKFLKAKIASGKATEAEVAEFKELAAKHGDNDVSWWKAFPSLIKDTANFVFNHIVGTPFTLADSGAGSTSPDTVMRIEARFIPGMNYKADSPYNQMMQQLWLFLHRKYRGLGAYEFADLGIIIWCIVHVFVEIARAMRIYAALNTYSIKNRTIPYSLVSALGVRASELTASGDDLARYRAEINRLVVKATTLCLPKGLPILKAYTEMISNVFKDADSPRGYAYLYDTNEYVVYDPKFCTGGRARYIPRTRMGNQTLKDVITDIETMMNALIGDTDVARVCSDLVAALGESGVVSVDSIPEMIELDIKYNDIRSLQLHNTTIFGVDHLAEALPRDFMNISGVGDYIDEEWEGNGADFLKEEYCIYQCPRDNGSIIVNALGFFSAGLGIRALDDCLYDGTQLVTVFSDAYPFASKSGPVLLDTWEDDPSEDTKVEMTRQTAGAAVVNDMFSHNNYSSIITAGHMLVTSLSLFYGDNAHTELYGNRIGAFTEKDPDDYSTMTFLSDLAKYDWHPLVYVNSSQETASASLAPHSIFGDLDNATVIRPETLRSLHEGCLLSAFKFENVEYTIRDGK